MRPTLMLLFCSMTCFAQGVTELLERKLVSEIESVDASLHGVLGVYSIDLTSGRAISYRGETVFPTASSIKPAILAEMFRAAKSGALRLDETVTLTSKDVVGGSGYLQKVLRRGPHTLTVRDLAVAMIEDSDNLATNRCIDLVGMGRVNALLDAAGLSTIRLRRKMMDTAAAARDEENVASPRDLARLLELMFRDKLDGSAEMIEIMKGVDADMRKAIPDSVPVASKPGELDGVRCEVGLVLLPKRPFVLAAMSTYLGPGENPVGAVTNLVYRYYEKLARSNATGRRLD